MREYTRQMLECLGSNGDFMFITNGKNPYSHLKLGVNNLGVEMLGNMKIKVTAKDGQKIINIVGFVEAQMEKLIEKFDDIGMNSESEEVISMLDRYSDFSEKAIKKLRGVINE